ncbi:hypothetical protein [Streptomyces sp. BE133]|uniref:hypothetical protein n=1 Tax=Streptomyces sp. BE133 TaxID=3002523 RepID=UPI002E7752AA|nr:hypothetical protein [Streptomyces sp. BE133]MEE1810153.1 hypothetical protein [Streptomyces sp. BE133]
MTDTYASGTRSRARQMLNKVPEVTIYFWVIKVLCTTEPSPTPRPPSSARPALHYVLGDGTEPALGSASSGSTTA